MTFQTSCLPGQPILKVKTKLYIYNAYMAYIAWFCLLIFSIGCPDKNKVWNVLSYLLPLCLRLSTNNIIIQHITLLATSLLSSINYIINYNYYNTNITSMDYFYDFYLFLPE